MDDGFPSEHHTKATTSTSTTATSPSSYLMNLPTFPSLSALSSSSHAATSVSPNHSSSPGGQQQTGAGGGVMAAASKAASSMFWSTSTSPIIQGKRMGAAEEVTPAAFPPRETNGGRGDGGGGDSYPSISHSAATMKDKRQKQQPEPIPEGESGSEGGITGGRVSAKSSSHCEMSTKNYRQLASEYRQFRIYRNLDGNQACVLCNQDPCEDVFFPCEHKCICKECMSHNKFGDSYTKGAWCRCPVCCSEIKKILPHTGAEVARYWEWVLEVKPLMPTGFLDRWSRTGRDLRRHIGRPSPEDDLPPTHQVLEELTESYKGAYDFVYSVEGQDDTHSCTCQIS